MWWYCLSVSVAQSTGRKHSYATAFKVLPLFPFRKPPPLYWTLSPSSNFLRKKLRWIQLWPKEQSLFNKLRYILCNCGDGSRGVHDCLAFGPQLFLCSYYVSSCVLCIIGTLLIAIEWKSNSNWLTQKREFTGLYIKDFRWCLTQDACGVIRTGPSHFIPLIFFISAYCHSPSRNSFRTWSFHLQIQT